MNSEKNNPSRRSFVKKSILVGSLLPLMHGKLAAGIYNPSQNSPLKVHIFSKHLQFLNYKEMAEAAAEIGFDGVDLTVRPKGHVLPERVEDDLPKAVEAIRKAGMDPLMMTSSVVDPESSTDQQVLKTASGLGMQYYRMNYFRYFKDQTIPESIRHFRQQAGRLSKLNRKMGIKGCYQNHAGNYMGASMWELWELLKDADHDYLGVQYDIRHAVVEGGLSWQNGLRLIKPHIKMLAIKDFRWENKNGKWVAVNTPLGEGMVDFPAYFQLLKQHQINVPVSLHLEYPIAGAEHGATKLSGDKKVVFDAMRRDLKKLHDLWQQVQ